MDLKKPTFSLFCFFAFLFSSGFDANAQMSESDFFLHGDMVYSDDIGTVLFHPTGNELASPRLLHNSTDRLILRFDDLDADFKNYFFTIIHCDAYWQPSNIQKFEYIDGFHEEVIRNFSRSINTVVPFTQYLLTFPTPDMRPRISGNYILKVYLNGNPDDVVFTRRFMVFEQNVGIDAIARQSFLPRFSDTHQQVTFTLNLGRHQVSNPERELRIVVTQNGRWDNAIKNPRPRIILGNELVFDNENELLFEGGNVFRRFDIRSLRAGSEFVDNVVRSPTFWEVFLRNDVNRSTQGFVHSDHINGRFMVKTFDNPDDHLEGDYAWVYFSLPFHEPIPNATVHIIGALTDWTPTEYNRMTYNYRENKYQASLFLKQGFYNYHFAVLKDGETRATVQPVEGTHSVAHNEYSIFVYHRRPGERFDRLVGIRQLSTLAW